MGLEYSRDGEKRGARRRSPLPTSLWAACALLSARSGTAQDLILDEHETRWRFTYDTVEIEGAPDLGLFGAHYEVLDAVDSLPGLVLGVGAFGGASGDLGGFFTGGLDVGWRAPGWHGFDAELGAFVGGGGGGGGPQGGGLMLRPFAALERELGPVALRLELAHTRFPNGDIADTGLAFGLTLPSESLTAGATRASRAAIPTDFLHFERVSFGPALLGFEPDSSARFRDGRELTDTILLGGVRIAAERGEWSYVPLELWGAVDGEVSGFAAVFAGYGLHGEVLTPALGWEIEALAGLGGGGDVDTGGGFMYEAKAGLRLRIARDWSLRAAVGRMGAPDGEFDGGVAEVSLSWDPRVLRLDSAYDRGRLGREKLAAGDGVADRWQLSVHGKVYRPSDSTRTTSGRLHEASLELLGIGLEHAITRHFSFTGRAYGAVSGGVGGYAEGLAGLRAGFSPAFAETSRLFLSYEVGAGGGGGMDVGSGLIHQASAGWLWSPMPGLELGLEAGRMEALDDGSFAAGVYGVSIAVDVVRVLAGKGAATPVATQ